MTNQPARSFFTEDSFSNSYTKTITENGIQKTINYYKSGVIKNFYKISEFYNFIKTPKNNPIATRNHVLVPYPHNGNQYFENKREQLYRMVLSFQNVSSLPDMTHMCGQDLDIITPVGRYSTMDNSAFGSSTNSFTAQFIEMNQPIHESFFYEWYLVCLNSGRDTTNTGSASNTHTFYDVAGNSMSNKKQTLGYPFPRLDFAIKYFRPDEMNPSVFETVIPTFVYWIMRSLSNIYRNI